MSKTLNGKRASATYVLTSILHKASSLLMLPLYTRLFSATEYGQYSLLISYVTFAAMLASLGMEFAVLKYCHPNHTDTITKKNAHKKGERQNHFSAALLLVSFGAIFVIIVSTAIMLLIGSDTVGGVELTGTVSIILLCLLFQPIQTIFLAQLQALGHARAFGAFTVGSFLLSSTFVVSSLYFLDLGVRGAIVAYTFSHLILMLTAIVSSLKLNFIGRKVSKYNFSNLLSYGLPMLPHSLTLQGTAFATRMIIGNTISIAAVGLFNVAMNAVNLIDAIQTALYRAFLPWYFSLRDRDSTGAKSRIENAVEGFVLVNTLVAVSVALLAEPALHILVGEEFQDAAYLVGLLSISMIVKALYYPHLTVILSFERGSKYVLAISLSSALVSLPLSYLGALQFGLIGIGFAQVLQRLMMTVLSRVISRKFERLPVLWRKAVSVQVVGAILCTVAFLYDLMDYGQESFVLGLALRIGAITVIATVLLFPYRRYLLSLLGDNHAKN